MRRLMLILLFLRLTPAAASAQSARAFQMVGVSQASVSGAWTCDKPHQTGNQT